MAVAIESVMYVLTVWQGPYTGPSCEIYQRHHHRQHHHQHCETSEYIKIYNQLVKVFKQAKLVKMVAYTHTENWELSHKSRSMIITGGPDKTLKVAFLISDHPKKDKLCTEQHKKFSGRGNMVMTTGFIRRQHCARRQQRRKSLSGRVLWILCSIAT